MKAAIIGAKNVDIEMLNKFLPKEVNEIAWVGNNDILVEYAKMKNITLTRFFRNPIYGNASSFIMTNEVLEYVDIILAFGNENDIKTKAIIDMYESTKKVIVAKANPSA